MTAVEHIITHSELSISVMHRDKVTKFKFPCSLCEHIHVNVNTENCGPKLEDVS